MSIVPTVVFSAWEINNPAAVQIIDSQGPQQGKVLALTPNNNVSALIKHSDQWGLLSIEGKMRFPKKEQNYLGFLCAMHVCHL